MNWVQEWARRVRMLFGGSRFDRDLQEEMRLHLELRRQDLIRGGVPPAQADAAAQRRFGNATVLREASGDAWGWRGLQNLSQDLRYGARGLLRTPAFSLLAILTLALGIGANTAIFSVVNAVLLNPLSYRDPGRLVTILHDGVAPVAPANYVDWRDQSRSFESMAAAEYWTPNLTGVDSPENLTGLHVTANLFPLLGIAPLMGRTFLPGEDRSGSEHEVVLSYRLWQRRFQGDPQVLGKPVLLNGEGYTVVGVMPATFQFAPFWATHAELWAPIVFGDRIDSRGGNSLRIFGRLKPGVSLTAARAEMAAITGRLETQYPGTNRHVMVRPLKENVVGKVETPLLIVMCGVGFVLLIACANVAHMLLARTSDRQREIAVRTALGAGRGRVMAQFLTENLLLAGLGAAAGLLLALWGVKGLVALSPAGIPRVDTVTLDVRAVLFLLVVTLLTAGLFGLAPAMQSSAANLSAALKEGGRGGSSGVARNRLRGFLVGSEFALAFILLVGAGLMIRSFFALQAVNPGFDPHHVLSMVVSVAGSGESPEGPREVFYRDLLEHVRAVPGVQSAGAINHLPLVGDEWQWNFFVEGRPKPRPGEAPLAVYRIVMPGYFDAMRLPIVRGRAIAAGDDSREPGVVVINQAAAREYWPGVDPIGQRITIENGIRLTIVGIAADARQSDWASQPQPETYLAALQNRAFLGGGDSHSSYITVVVRAAGDPAALAPAVKQTVWGLDRNLPISQVTTMDHAVADATAEPRFLTLLLAVFASVALLLAAVGIYGVMSYAVARRTHEIGIRISLGATRGDVLRMVVRQGMAQALAGALAGAGGALLLGRLMAGMLYGVRPNDLVTFGVVGVVLGTAALLAICVPARRATRIEPTVALRQE
ncbi:MAG TPA: ABC transporter permease [Bryobacteraceae bacterium]|jgi:putative ABC transport system permease protein|nr:ABC transporter permease [Bryobacteraceae bacterium]